MSLFCWSPRIPHYPSVGEIPPSYWEKESRYLGGRSTQNLPKMEDGVKRERTLQVVLVLLGLFYSFWGYILFDNLWNSRWLGQSDVMPMFLSLNTVLGVFLLLAVKHPAKHRSVIAYGAWSSLAHAFTMTIQSWEAAAHGMHRKDSPQDIVIFVVIGVALLALLPARQTAPASAPITEPNFAER